jgi:hypothetical protein
MIGAVYPIRPPPGRAAERAVNKDLGRWQSDFVGVTAYASKLPTPPVQLLAIDASNAGGGLWDVRITGIVDRWKVYGKTRYVDPVAPLVTLFSPASNDIIVNIGP